MRCWLFTFALSIALLKYVHGSRKKNMYQYVHESHVHGFSSSEEHSSREPSKVNMLLAGTENNLSRSLVAGDTFTPQEMLPIAEKLFKKVSEPGSGSGFVSSTKGPKELADKLFEAFFFNTKRIVTLKDNDIIGIDALQALALEGEEADDTKVEEVTEPAQKMYLRGQLVDIKKLKPLRSHYKLVTKVVPQRIQKRRTKRTKGKRRGIPLSKKLPPKRHLVVNEQQQRERKQNENKKNNKKVTRLGIINRLMKNNNTPVKRTTKQDKNKANCHWKYVCTTPGDLDTCRVHTTCGNSSIFETPEQTKVDKNLVDQFRRMVGITAVDEEVEKILEVRNLKLRPVNLEAVERVESLAEFFNNIIVRENIEATKSMPTEHFQKVSSNLHITEPDQSKND